MEDMKIEGSASTPEITFLGDGNLYIGGYSLPEDTINFYKPIFNWTDSLIRESPDTVSVTFNFIYFNTSTAKIIVDFLRILKKGLPASNQLSVIWKFDEQDEEMEEVAERIEEIIGLQIEKEPIAN